MYGAIMTRHITARQYLLDKALRRDAAHSPYAAFFPKTSCRILDRPMQAFCLGLERYTTQFDKQVAI